MWRSCAHVTVMCTCDGHVYMWRSCAHVMVMCTTHLCPWNTSCDSSITFHTLTVRSFMPADTGRSRLRQSMDDTLSWWPNLKGGQAKDEREQRERVRGGDKEEKGGLIEGGWWRGKKKKSKMGTPRRMKEKGGSKGTENEDRGRWRIQAFTQEEEEVAASYIWTYHT